MLRHYIGHLGQKEVQNTALVSPKFCSLKGMRRSPPKRSREVTEIGRVTREVTRTGP